MFLYFILFPFSGWKYFYKSCSKVKCLFYKIMYMMYQSALESSCSLCLSQFIYFRVQYWLCIFCSNQYFFIVVSDSMSVFVLVCLQIVLSYQHCQWDWEGTPAVCLSDHGRHSWWSLPCKQRTSTRVGWGNGTGGEFWLLYSIPK